MIVHKWNSQLAKASWYQRERWYRYFADQA